ncbi:MAG: glycosyltransferase family 2 protein [Candidatus Omnitrophota bacterium]
MDPGDIAMSERVKSPTSVIIPAYNEEPTIRQVISGLLDERRYPEIIVVDDSSSDKTGFLAEELRVKVIRHETRRGYGAALKTGIKYARGDIIIILDADDTYSPGDIKRLLKSFEAGGYDMVVGVRDLGHFPFYQKFAKGFVTSVMAAIFRQKVPDINSGLRVMKREVVEKYLSVLSDGFSFTASSTLAMLLGRHKIGYVEVGYSGRAGRSNVEIAAYTINFIRSYWRVIYRLKIAAKLSRGRGGMRV